MPESSRVSTLELFFDLVFVFTISQVALIVEEHPSWESAGQALVELAVIFWMYGGFAWLTNILGSSTPRQRAVLLAGMASFFVVSLSVPRAFGADGVGFGVAYLVLNLVHFGGFMLRGRVPVRALLRVGAINIVAAVLILVAGISGVHWPLWLIAVALQYLPSILTRTTGSFDISVGHFTERHGLMIIIALGESLVSVAIAAQRLEVSVQLAVGALCGLAALSALWWCYFVGDDDAGARAFGQLDPLHRGRMALLAYGVSHVLLIAGVLAVAAGSRLSLPELTRPTSWAAAGFIAGGAALYLAAMALFRAQLRYATPVLRAGGAIVLLATFPIGTHGGAAQQLAAVAVIVVAVLVAESVARGRGTLRAGDADRAGWRA